MTEMNDSSKINRQHLYGWLAFLLAFIVILSSILLPHHSLVSLKIISLGLLVMSAPLMFTPFLYLKKYGNVPAGKAYYETSELVVLGPYRVVRHPQYVGYSLLVLGFALMLRLPVTVLPAIFAVLIFYLQALGEEEQCFSTFGGQYKDYAARVPRFNIVIGVWRLLRHRGLS